MNAKTLRLAQVSAVIIALVLVAAPAWFVASVFGMLLR